MSYDTYIRDLQGKTQNLTAINTLSVLTGDLNVSNGVFTSYINAPTISSNNVSFNNIYSNHSDFGSITANTIYGPTGTFDSLSVGQMTCSTGTFQNLSATNFYTPTLSLTTVSATNIYGATGSITSFQAHDGVIETLSSNTVSCSNVSCNNITLSTNPVINLILGSDLSLSGLNTAERTFPSTFRVLTINLVNIGTSSTGPPLITFGGSGGYVTGLSFVSGGLWAPGTSGTTAWSGTSFPITTATWSATIRVNGTIKVEKVGSYLIVSAITSRSDLNTGGTVIGGCLLDSSMVVSKVRIACASGTFIATASIGYNYQ